MNNSTKWDRVVINEALMQSIREIRLDYIPTYKIAVGIQSTTYPFKQLKKKNK